MPLLEIAVPLHLLRQDQVKPTVEHEGSLRFGVVKPGS